MCPYCGSEDIAAVSDDDWFDPDTEIGFVCYNCCQEWSVSKFMFDDSPESIPSVESTFKKTIVKLLQVENHERGPTLMVLIKFYDPDKVFLGFEPYTSCILNLEHDKNDGSITYQDITPQNVLDYSSSIWRRFCRSYSKKELHELSLLIYKRAYEQAKEKNSIGRRGTIIQVCEMNKVYEDIRENTEF